MCESPTYRRDSGEAPARPRYGVAEPGFELSLLSVAYTMLLSPTHSCLHRKDPFFTWVFLPIPNLLPGPGTDHQ